LFECSCKTVTVHALSINYKPLHMQSCVKTQHKRRTLSEADSKCLQEPPWTWHRSRSPCVTRRSLTRNNCQLHVCWLYLTKRFAAFLCVPAFSDPAFSTPDIWSRIFRSCIFSAPDGFSSLILGLIQHPPRQNAPHTLHKNQALRTQLRPVAAKFLYGAIELSNTQIPGYGSH